ncbi:MAG: hypothetical protein ACK5LY_05005 [Lachnospirales bacterium]
MNEEIKILETSNLEMNGQTKCPKCGATDISQNSNNGKLRCNFCRFEFLAEVVLSINGDIRSLVGEEIGSGLKDIDDSFNGTLTIGCTSCGAEVVIDTNETTTARCHWCRNTLSVNEQLPNGAVPDAVLPFSVKSEEALSTMKRFVKSRTFFANKQFIKEFENENIMGVFFPYMTVDVNAKASLVGKGEVLIRKYSVKVGKNSRSTRYDADLYSVARKFDLTINDLTIEANANRLNKISTQTNNIINSVMPFDIKNSVKWDANYLKGFTSEKRDVNIENIRSKVTIQSKDISRFRANETLKQYNRGVCWEDEQLEVVGQRWHGVYLPVWLYSYQEVKSSGSVLHYIAVNGRNQEVMGSIPINYPKLLMMSFFVEFFGGIATILTLNEETILNFIFLTSGFLFYFYNYKRYSNRDERHKHEVDTEANIYDVDEEDNFIVRKKGLSNSRMTNANNRSISGESSFDNLMNKYGFNMDDLID